MAEFRHFVDVFGTFWMGQMVPEEDSNVKITPLKSKI
jgi:hypothetical protein